MSQRELAEMIDSTQPTIARLEAGGMAPSIQTLDFEMIADGGRFWLRMAPGDEIDQPPWGLDEEDEEKFFAAWDAAEAAAVDLLRQALPELIEVKPSPDALAVAVAGLRSGMAAHSWPHEHMRRSAGFTLERLPKDDLELWLGAVGGLIAMREESGLSSEDEASIMAQEHADWLGAVIGLVRAGVGGSAEPEALVRYINDCPEVDGVVDPEDALVVENAFELVLPAWEAAKVVDADRRLTPLGRWGLPRALAWAWGGDFDHAPESPEPG
ncbi:MAG: helix-turn-helix domain-containing protein [Actinomycetota bacterium]|nr:helix-turn-helix domain-containing protein [Actinomycetota bacterium]